MVVKKKRKKKEASTFWALRKEGMSIGMQVIVIAIFLILVLIAVTLMFNLSWKQILSNIKIATGTVSADMISNVFTPVQLEEWIKEGGDPKIVFQALKPKFEDYDTKYGESCKEIGILKDIVDKFNAPVEISRSSVYIGDMIGAKAEEAHWKLIKCYKNRGDKDSAKKYLIKYKEIYCSDEKSGDHCGVVDSFMGEIEKVQSDNENYAAAMINYEEKRYNEAVEQLNLIIESEDSDPSIVAAAHYWRGHINLLKFREEGKGLEDFDKVETDYKNSRFPDGSYGGRDGESIVSWVYRDYIEYFENDLKKVKNYYDNFVSKYGKKGEAYQSLIKSLQGMACGDIKSSDSNFDLFVNNCILHNQKYPFIPDVRCYIKWDGDVFSCSSCADVGISYEADCMFYDIVLEKVSSRIPGTKADSIKQNQCIKDPCKLGPCELKRVPFETGRYFTMSCLNSKEPPQYEPSVEFNCEMSCGDINSINQPNKQSLCTDKMAMECGRICFYGGKGCYTPNCDTELSCTTLKNKDQCNLAWGVCGIDKEGYIPGCEWDGEKCGNIKCENIEIEESDEGSIIDCIMSGSPCVISDSDENLQCFSCESVTLPKKCINYPSLLSDTKYQEYIPMLCGEDPCNFGGDGCKWDDLNKKCYDVSN